MKKKLLTLLALSGTVAIAAVAGRAGASGLSQLLTADLVLRPGVSHVGHPAVVPHALYGALDAYYDPGTGRFAYVLDYKGLNGPVTRVALRSRATGATYLVLCAPCRPVLFPHASHEGSTVSKLAGVLKLNPDTGYLMDGDKTFIEVDTTARPGGEIGAPVILYVPPVVRKGHPVTKSEPRCC